MKDFKYLSSLPYPKSNQEDRPQKSSTLRRSLDLPSGLKPQRNMKTAELTLDNFSSPPFPYFRPRSPITSLAKSIQISKFSNTFNNFNSESPSNRHHMRVSSVLNSHQFMDLVNPHTPFKGSFLVIKKSELSGTVKKKRFYRSIDIGHKIKINKTVKMETLSIREVRDKKWMNKKIDLILSDFYSVLNRSNGIKVMKNIEFVPQFKYYVGKGNNSKLVKDLMAKRNGWVRVKSDDFNQVNFIWTEWLQGSVMAQLPSVSPAHRPGLIDVKPHRTYQYKQSNYKRFIIDLSALGYAKISDSSEYKTFHEHIVNSQEIRIYSKLQGNHNLSNKKELFVNLTQYCKEKNLLIFEYIPITFHVLTPEDSQLALAEKNFNQIGGLWIVKPGEDTNRGSGIVICNTWDQIKKEVAKGRHTYIIQKYIENPLLIYKRKFDIRLYCLVTCFNGIVQGYYYNEGYLRTSSKYFSLNLTDKFIHLTNDAIQKRSDDYGKYENGNKMSYNEFQKYLENYTSLRAVDFNEKLLPKIRDIVALTIRSAVGGLLKDRKNFTFEVFGYDFLVDSEFKPWLLEVNTNPCLEISSSHLARIIPTMLDNAFQIALDSIFRCPSKLDGQVLTENRFELIFNSEKMN